MSGRKRRPAPTTEFSEVAATTTLALAIQLLAAAATFRLAAAAAIGSRPTLIINPPEKANTTDSYIGYYADIDDNGTVDGIIYADLAHAKSGQWGDNWGGYSYSAVTSGLKEYYIKGEHTEDNSFGTKPVIAPVDKNDTRKDRFYVMALEDVNPGTRYCWYDAAYGSLDKTVSYSTNDFGSGRENTEYVMNKWKNKLWGAQDDNGTYKDMWGVIETKVNEGWFVASKSEWSAFGEAFSLRSNNYGNYELRDWYWSSSQHTTDRAYNVNFNSGYMNRNTVHSHTYVRLCATF